MPHFLVRDHHRVGTLHLVYDLPAHLTLGMPLFHVRHHHRVGTLHLVHDLPAHFTLGMPLFHVRHHHGVRALHLRDDLPAHFALRVPLFLVRDHHRVRLFDGLPHGNLYVVGLGLRHHPWDHHRILPSVGLHLGHATVNVVRFFSHLVAILADFDRPRLHERPGNVDGGLHHLVAGAIAAAAAITPAATTMAAPARIRWSKLGSHHGDQDRRHADSRFPA